MHGFYFFFIYFKNTKRFHVHKYQVEDALEHFGRDQ